MNRNKINYLNKIKIILLIFLYSFIFIKLLNKIKDENTKFDKNINYLNYE